MKLYLIACLLYVLYIQANASQELKLLHVISRHGARTPADTYPKDPYLNETFQPYGWGQLINQGKLDIYHNGQFIRHKYRHFIGEEYNPNEFYCQSTDADRTLCSAELTNAGTWPPNHRERWGPLMWQPVPVHTEPLNKDKLLLVRIPCPQYHIELERVMKEDPEVRQNLDDNKELMKNLTELTGLQINNFDDIQSLYSTLKAETGYGLILPPWTQDYYPDKLVKPTEYSYIVNAYTDRLKRLKGGVLLRKLLVDWYQIAYHTTNNSSPLTQRLLSPEWIKDASAYGSINKDRKFFLYLGHDSTITNLLIALNVWEMQMPDYGITVMIELLEDKETNQFGIQIYLRNQTDQPPHLLTIPGCQSFCPLDQLTTIVEPVVPIDLDEECKTDDPSYEHPEIGGP